VTTQPRPARLDPATVRDWLAGDDGPRLLDVRSPAEFETAHIPGSYNVPLHLLREHRDEISRHLDQVVLVCRSGNRAARAEAVLAETGMTNLHLLAAGTLVLAAVLGSLLSRLPFNRAASCDVDTVVRQLTDAGTVRS
jgi:rhodanese-related sulfurtransferase